jgi:ATP-binding cassette subfamily C (CFTR/MRP) protein 1
MSLSFAVKQLEDADHIIVLGMEGKILEQGSYTKLLTSGTYVQKLARSQRRDKLSETRTSPLDTSPHATPEQTEAPIVVDKSRQTGDWKIYKYYAGSMGWLSLFTFSSLVAMNSAASTLQCKFPLEISNPPIC